MRTMSSSLTGVVSRTVPVKSGPEFATAMADPGVGVIRLASMVVSITMDDWNSINSSENPLPLVLTRNVTIEGDPGLADWPALDFNGAKRVVRRVLGSSVARVARRCIGGICNTLVGS